jgi:glycosyltransferase involved in cell wall biosynthesis
VPAVAKLSVVIPVYNEKGTFEELLGRIARVPISKELVIVDDASTDGTRERIRALEDRYLHREDAGPGLAWMGGGAASDEGATQGDRAAAGRAGMNGRDGPLERTAPPGGSAPLEMVFVYQEVNRGKGAAVREGIARTTGDIVLVQDADLEYDPADYPSLVAPIVEGRADVVYGSRLRSGALRNGYFGNYLANRGLTLLSNLFTGLRLTDMETCYKVMRGEIARGLTLTADRFGFDPEITAKLARGGHRFTEVPGSYAGRSYAEGKKIRWKDALVVVRAILRYAGGD